MQRSARREIIAFSTRVARAIRSVVINPFVAHNDESFNGATHALWALRRAVCELGLNL